MGREGIEELEERVRKLKKEIEETEREREGGRRRSGEHDGHRGHGHEGEKKMSGYHVRKRDLWLVAGGALSALAAFGVGAASRIVRPAAVGAVKEGYAFKEWLAGKYERAKEDVEDIVEEAKHAYHKDLEATAEALKKEKEILEKVEEAVKKKTTRRKGRKKEE